jgi:prepilin-type N-terminal cleavage/methylation domain-containing protein
MNKGFSLIELLIVMVIVGIIASIVTFNYIALLANGRVSAAATNVKNLLSQLDRSRYRYSTTFISGDPPQRTYMFNLLPEWSTVSDLDLIVDEPISVPNNNYWGNPFLLHSTNRFSRVRMTIPFVTNVSGAQLVTHVGGETIATFFSAGTPFDEIQSHQVNDMKIILHNEEVR